MAVLTQKEYVFVDEKLDELLDGLREYAAEVRTEALHYASDILLMELVEAQRKQPAEVK
jgi:hypothetical protein